MLFRSTKESEFCDIIAKQDDIPTLNYIMERMGYTAPTQEQEGQEEPEKKAQPRAKQSKEEEKNQNPDPQHENNSDLHGNISKGTGGQTRTTKPSVKEKLDDYKADIAATNKQKNLDKQKSGIVNSAPPKKKKSKQKSK